MRRQRRRHSSSVPSLGTPLFQTVRSDGVLHDLDLLQHPRSPYHVCFYLVEFRFSRYFICYSSFPNSNWSAVTRPGRHQHLACNYGFKASDVWSVSVLRMTDICIPEGQRSCIISNGRYIRYGKSAGWLFRCFWSQVSYSRVCIPSSGKKNSIFFNSWSTGQEFLKSANKRTLRNPNIFLQILSWWECWISRYTCSGESQKVLPNSTVVRVMPFQQLLNAGRLYTDHADFSLYTNTRDNFESCPS